MRPVQSGSATKRVLMTMACLAMGGLALLLWARLKLVTGVPRTALADPKQSAPARPLSATPSR